MAKLTESYLKSMIKQIIEESFGPEGSFGSPGGFGPPGSSDKPKKRIQNTSLVYKRAKKKIESGLKLSDTEKEAVIKLLDEIIEDYGGGPDYGI